MSIGSVPLQSQPRVTFRTWELTLLLVSVPLFVATLLIYATDFPVLRRYVFNLDPSASSENRVGEVVSTTGRVRRQRAIESEFVAIGQGDSVQNQDTVVTDPGVTASIRLDDGGTIDLSSDTMVRIAFDSEISIGGVTRQASVQLVTGTVTGQTKSQKIVVKTLSGKVATLGNQQNQEIVREEPVIPKKVEIIAAAIPVEVIEASFPPPMELASEEKKVEESAPVISSPVDSPSPPIPPSPTVAPKPRITSATLSMISPVADEQVLASATVLQGKLPLELSFVSSRPDGRFRVQLKGSDGWLGGKLMDERVEAREGKVKIPVALERPGRYEWSVEDLDAESPLISQVFEVLPAFQGITLLEATLPGATDLSNRLATELMERFPGIELRWKPAPLSEAYEVEVFSSEKSTKPVLKAEVDEPRLLYSKGTLLKEPVYFRVSARLKNGFRATSPTGHVQFRFSPPTLSEPKDQESLNANAGRPTTVLLTWSHTNFTDSYEVQVSQTASFGQFLEKRQTPDNFYSFSARDPGTYFWRIRAIGPGIQSAYSTVRSFTVR